MGGFTSWATPTSWLSLYLFWFSTVFVGKHVQSYTWPREFRIGVLDGLVHEGSYSMSKYLLLCSLYCEDTISSVLHEAKLHHLCLLLDKSKSDPYSLMICGLVL